MGEFSPELVRAGFEKAGVLEPRAQQVVWAPEPVVRPPVLCAGCPHTSAYMAVRATGARVAGDIGCYTLAALDPLRGIDTCVSMGSSIGVACGMAKAGETQAGAGHHRRLDLPARRHPAADRRGLQQREHHGDAARQPHHRDDRRPGPPRHRQDPARRGRPAGRLRGADPRGRRQVGAQGRLLRHGGGLPDAARGDRAPRRVGGHLGPPLRAGPGEDQGPAAGDRQRRCATPASRA